VPWKIRATPPAICVKCGARDRVGARPKRFRFVPSSGRVLSILFGLIYISNDFASQVTLRVPLCRDCAERWDRVKSAHRKTTLGCWLSILALFGVGMAFDSFLAFTLGALLLLLALPVLRIFERVAVRPKILWIEGFDAKTAYVGGVHSRAARAIQKAGESD
jgi:hypothetical protein